MDKLMAQFIEEARDLISSAGQVLLALEKAPTDRTLLDTLFRDVHTLKGSAGVLELNAMVRIVHVAEELLELSKEGEFILSADCIDVLLDTFDVCNSWVDGLDDVEALPGDADHVAQAYVDALTELRDAQLSSANDAERVPDDVPGSGEGVSWGLFDDSSPALLPENMGAPTAERPPQWLFDLPEATRRAAWEASQRGDPLWLIEFQPEAECFFRGDDPLFMVRQTPGLLAIDATVPQPEEPLENWDVFQCLLRFGALSHAADDVLAQHYQYETDTVQRKTLSSDWLVQPSGESIGSDFDQAVLTDLSVYWENRQLDQLSSVLNVQLELLNPHCQEASILRWLQALVAHAPDDAELFDGLLAVLRDPAEALDAMGLVAWGGRMAGAEGPTAQNDTAPLMEAEDTASFSGSAGRAADQELNPRDTLISDILGDQLRLLDLCQEPELRSGAYAAARQVLRALATARASYLPAELEEAEDAASLAQVLRRWLLGATGEEARDTPSPMVPKTTPPAPMDVAEPTAAKSPPEPQESRTSAAPLIRSFKVGQEQMEDLGDLVGELVVAKNALPFLAQRAEQVFGERQLGREIREQFNIINRIARALQDAMMQVQMLPVSHVFDRFPRLIRDLSRKLDKTIDLEVTGADTEAEKHVIETLADPLVHLMRNSIDHGIESRALRIESGKPETGQIALTAHRDNEWVVIEVRDDGAGIDPSKTRLKAYEKGLLDERRLNDLTDKEAIDLIFMPGFSTLENATELSGRGVGLDVVRSAIEKAGGRIDLSSTLGEGTVFRLYLPLSMSISQVMQTWIDGQRYGIPMDQVAETVRLPTDRIHRFKDRETVMLRDRVLPVYRSRSQLGLSSAAESPTVALLVVRYRGDLVALVVDDFSESVEVILKPMEGALENLGVYQGTALLGDGSVLLVLNVGVLLSSVKLEEAVHEHSG